MEKISLPYHREALQAMDLLGVDLGINGWPYHFFLADAPLLLICGRIET
jgi:hypothetical protein